MRPKQPDFGYSGAEFPRANARIPKPLSTGVENDVRVLITRETMRNKDAQCNTRE